MEANPPTCRYSSDPDTAMHKGGMAQPCGGTVILMSF